jgi:hypothetical protein
MTQKAKRKDLETRTSDQPSAMQRRFELAHKVFDSITAAGPIGWVCAVAIIGFCAIVAIVYIMSGNAAIR